MLLWPDTPASNHLGVAEHCSVNMMIELILTLRRPWSWRDIIASWAEINWRMFAKGGCIYAAMGEKLLQIYGHKVLSPKVARLVPAVGVGEPLLS